MRNLIVFSLICLSSHIYPQTADWQYYAKDNSINSLTLDNDNLWVGLNSGLLKLNTIDGSKAFYNRINSPLPESWISDVAVDGNGIKWITTWIKGTLLRFDDNQWIIYDEYNSPLPGNGCSLTNVEIGNNNDIWLSTACINTGLIKFDGVNWMVYQTSNSGIPSNYIFAMYCSGNKVWMTSSLDLFSFDGTNWTIYNTENSNISGHTIFDIDEDSQGNIWLLHGNGVEKFDGHTFTLFDNSNTNIPNINNYKFDIDSLDNIWTTCISYGFSPEILGGIMKFDGVQWTKFDTLNADIPDIDISPILIGPSDELWYGCANLGMVGKKTGDLWTVFDPSNSGLHHSQVRQIVNGTGHATYIGTSQPKLSGSALVGFDWGSWIDLPYYGSNTYKMTISTDGKLYIKNRDGIRYYQNGIWHLIPDPPTLYAPSVPLGLSAMSADAAGNIWIDYLSGVETYFDPNTGQYYYVAKEGLARFDGNSWTTFTPENSPIPDADISQIQTDLYGNTWIGTNQGLLLNTGNDWLVYNTSNSEIPFNNIYSFAVDSSGSVWFPDCNLGFYRFDLLHSEHFPYPGISKDRYTGEVVLDIDGTPWQTGLFSLIHFDGKEWEEFNAENAPLPYGNVLSLSIDQNGNKWIGTQFGVMVYKAGGVITSSNSPVPEGNNYTIFPNPFSEYFEIQFDNIPGKVIISIYNTKAQLVCETTGNSGSKVMVPRKNMHPGLYFYRISTGGKLVAAGKIVAL